MFLLALCVIIILESIEKFIQPEPVEEPLRVAFVGLGGLIMNIIGIFMFWGDGTGHGHSHGGDSGHSHGHSHGDSHEKEGESHGSQAEQLNMKGILLHVMGDFFGKFESARFVFGKFCLSSGPRCFLILKIKLFLINLSLKF